MDLGELLKRKDLTSKEKTEAIASAVLSGELAIGDLVDFASSAKDPVKATCMEALEYVTSQSSSMASLELLKFAHNHLNAKASRLKWESAKVIGNIAYLFPDDLESAITGLLENTKDSSTVVRWSSAYALTQIAELPNYANNDFRSRLKEICESEEKNSIKKMYLKVLGTKQ